jgi:hypothetical protein
VQPYVIQQGDFLLQLAQKFGFDADTVWKDPSNSDLATLRSNHAILFPGDMLQIPNQMSAPPPATSLTPGSSNNFVSDAATVTLTQQFVGADPTAYASKAFTVQELAQLTGLATDGSGIATFPAPVTLETLTLTFTESGESWVLQLGQMDPINTLSGIFKRLQNIGYIGSSAQFDPSNLDLLRAGLSSLEASQATADASPGSTPASTPPASSDATSGSGPSSSPSSAPPSGSSDANTFGLADDGTLDTATTAMLLAAHGC